MIPINYSVVIPHYNSQDSLEVLLSSIPPRPDIEIIVVDDNSGVSLSGTKEKFNHVHFFINNSGNKGAGAARNIGVANATGRFLLFADSDDFFTDDAFSILDEYTEADKGFDLIYFSPRSISQVGGKSSRHKRYSLLVSDYINDGDATIRYMFHVPWSKLISKNLLVDNSIEFDEVLASNDVNFSLKVGLSAANIEADLRPIYCVVDKPGTLTKVKSEAVIDSRFDALCRYNDYLIAKGEISRLYAMSGHLKNALKFGFYKFLYRFFYCKYKGYPIFYGVKHIIRAVRKIGVS